MSSIGAIPDSNNNINRTNNKKPLVKASSNQPLFEFKQTPPTNPIETQNSTTNTPNSDQPANQNTNRAKINDKKIQEVKDLKEKAKILNEGTGSDVIVAGEEEVPL